MIICVIMMVSMCNDCMCVTSARVKIVLLMCYMCDIFVMAVYVVAIPWLVRLYVEIIHEL